MRNALSDLPKKSREHRTHPPIDHANTRVHAAFLPRVITRTWCACTRDNDTRVSSQLLRVSRVGLHSRSSWTLNGSTFVRDQRDELNYRILPNTKIFISSILYFRLNSIIQRFERKTKGDARETTPFVDRSLSNLELAKCTKYLRQATRRVQSPFNLHSFNYEFAATLRVQHSDQTPIFETIQKTLTSFVTFNVV